MPGWAKILLAVIGIIVAILIAGGFIGYHWVMKNKGQFTAMRQQGIEFGKGKDSNQCVDAALSRLSGTLMSSVNARVFAGGCLTSATDSPDLCASVPPATEIIKSAQWGVEQCRKRGTADQQGCSQIFQEVMVHCRSGSR